MIVSDRKDTELSIRRYVRMYQSGSILYRESAMVSDKVSIHSRFKSRYRDSIAYIPYQLTKMLRLDGGLGLFLALVLSDKHRYMNSPSFMRGRLNVGKTPRDILGFLPHRSHGNFTQYFPQHREFKHLLVTTMDSKKPSEGVLRTSSDTASRGEVITFQEGPPETGNIYGSVEPHVFSDPASAQYWREVFEKAQYECRHRFDTSFQWSAQDEKLLKWKVDTIF